MANTARGLRGFPRRRLDARCAAACIVYAGRTLLALIALSACDPIGPTADAGDDGDAGDASTALSFVDVRIGADEEELPDEWQLEEAWVSLESVRVDNDRGTEFEPVWSSPGRVRLDEESERTRLDAIPATYGGVALRSQTDAAFELTLVRGEVRVHAISRRPFDELMIRCSSGAPALRPGEVVDLEATLAIAPMVAIVAERVGEPSEDVELDASAVAELEEAFDVSWSLECDSSSP